MVEGEAACDLAIFADTHARTLSVSKSLFNPFVSTLTRESGQCCGMGLLLVKKLYKVVIITARLFNEHLCVLRNLQCNVACVRVCE